MIATVLIGISTGFIFLVSIPLCNSSHYQLLLDCRILANHLDYLSMPPSTHRKSADKGEMLTLTLNRSASYWCQVGQQTWKILLDPMPVHCWLSSTKLLGAKPVLSACSCTPLHSTPDLGLCANLSPRFPLICLLFATTTIMTTSSRMTYAFARYVKLSLLKADQYHILMEVAETEDFQQVASLQRFTQNMKCHSTRSSLPRCWSSFLVASFLARPDKAFPTFACSV